MKITSLFVILLLPAAGFTQKRIAVIGGGIAGVSAAHYIHQYDKNAQVTVFEKEAVLGGNAQTIEVTTGSGEKCLVDSGPQYFSKGPWDDYLAFLDETLGLETIATESTAGTLLIQRKDREKPLMVTPLNGKLRGEKLGNLLKLKRFNMEAYKAYMNPDLWKEKNIGQWVETLDFTEQYKTEIIYPFLAASLGTNSEDIRKTSAFEIVSLFAFRKPKASNSFFIMQEGMGGLIGRIGQNLERSGVNVAVSSPVLSVKRAGEQFVVQFEKDGSVFQQEFDFVVMAVHADIAGKLLSQEGTLKETSTLLGQFPYFDAHIVLHRDTAYINTRKPAFLNIFSDKDNQLLFSTMNLSMISPRLDGIYKSWMSEEDTRRVKEKGLFLHETTFYHPLITPEFVANLEKLHAQVDQVKGLCIIGGWTEGLETQNSAVLSAKRALEVYQSF